MRFFIINLFPVFILLTAPSYAYPGICKFLLVKTSGLFRTTQDISEHEKVINHANKRVRKLLGSLYPEDHKVDVKFETCLAETGCGFNGSLGVLQLDSKPILQNAEALGATYIHELGHSIQFSKIPETVSMREKLHSYKNRLLRAQTAIHRLNTKFSTQDYGLIDTFKYFYAEHRRNRVLEKMERNLNEEDIDSHEEYEKNEMSRFLKMSSYEVFADLLSCAAFSDGDIMARTLKIMDGFDHTTRSNSSAEEIPHNINWQTRKDLDEHHSLAPARRLIWKHYLEGKSDVEVRKALGVLDRSSREWAEKSREFALYSPVVRNMKEVDVNRLNRSFLEFFEKNYREGHL